MKILKYSYICMFSATAGIMTACAPDGQEGMFPGKGEPVTVKFSIDTRAAETDDFDSQVKTLRVYAFQNGSPVGYYYGGEDVPAHTFKWKLPKGEVWFYAVANEQEAGELLCENKGDIFVLPGETVGGVHPVEGLEVVPDRLESLTFSRLPEAEYVSGGTATDKDETGKKYRSAIVPMTCKYRGTVTHDNQEINLELKRSIAKLQLYFAKADVADAGEGQLYMGRGLYLYNMPEYGYLFPKEKYEYTGDFNFLEGAGENSDSKNQKNGKVIHKVRDGRRNRKSLRKKGHRNMRSMKRTCRRRPISTRLRLWHMPGIQTRKTFSGCQPNRFICLPTPMKLQTVILRIRQLRVQGDII